MATATTFEMFLQFEITSVKRLRHPEWCKPNIQASKSIEAHTSPYPSFATYTFHKTTQNNQRSMWSRRLTFLYASSTLLASLGKTSEYRVNGARPAACSKYKREHQLSAGQALTCFPDVDGPCRSEAAMTGWGAPQDNPQYSWADAGHIWPLSTIHRRRKRKHLED